VAHDPECRLITGNPAFDAILEIAPGANASKTGDQAELLPYKVMIDGREVPADHLPMQEAARCNATLRDLECDLVFQDGRVRNLYQYASPLYTEAGEVRGCMGVFVDITERKRAERALRDTNERLRLALAASNMGTWTRELADADDRLFWSPELEAIFGLKPGEFAGTEQAFFEFVHPEDRELIHRAMSRAVGGRTDYEVEFRFMPRGRAMGWMLGRGRAYYDERGRPVRLAGVGIDITARKETEEALREKRQQWQLITDALPVLIAHVDANERFRFSNRAYENWFSIPNERITGRTVREVVGDELYERLYPRIHTALAGGEQSFEEVFPRAGAAPRPVYVHYIPDFNSAGAVQGIHVLMTDISAHRRAEEEIRQLNATLERRVAERTAQWEIANKELEAFCYSVSHDLRAPLRTIRGFSEVVLEQYSSQVDSRGQEYLRRACDAACQMDQLIDDLLKLSRVSRGEMRRQEVNLSVLTEAIAAELKRYEPGRAVEFAIAPDLRAHGDERLLRLVMENLLRNAWKFTGKRAGARIAFERAPEAEHAFAIRDNGAGFDMAYADKLFGVFQRLHSTSEFPGTGVGLAIVQRIINRHGGRVWAAGEIDRGATFYFTLPAAADS
jgi:PAS domain S-box-containing protein